MTVLKKDPKLQHILKGEGFPVIHDDFMTFHTGKQYDLIAMNPPFSNGDEHLLKALDMQKNGGYIICILNAETIRNPFTLRRKELTQRLEGASIEFLQQEFTQAERRTEVEIALVKIQIPKKKTGIKNLYGTADKTLRTESFCFGNGGP